MTLARDKQLLANLRCCILFASVSHYFTVGEIKNYLAEIIEIVDTGIFGI